MFDVKFIQALAYALSREVVLSDDYYNQMTTIQRQQSVSIAGLAQLEHVKSVINQVNQAIDSGSTFADFQKAVKNGDVDINLPRHRLDNIFRTNIQAAYGRGRWYQQQQTKSTRPYLMYDAINDNRTRPAHKALDGTIRHIDDKFWDTHFAPLGYRCRCVLRSLTEAQAKARGITSDEDLPDVEADSKDWGRTPKDYNENFDKLVRSKISDLMIEYYQNAKSIDSAYARIKQSIVEYLDKPVVDLSILITQAVQYLEDNPDEFN